MKNGKELRRCDHPASHFEDILSSISGEYKELLGDVENITDTQLLQRICANYQLNLQTYCECLKEIHKKEKRHLEKLRSKAKEFDSLRSLYEKAFEELEKEKRSRFVAQPSVIGRTSRLDFRHRDQAEKKPMRSTEDVYIEPIFSRDPLLIELTQALSDILHAMRTSFYMVARARDIERPRASLVFKTAIRKRSRSRLSSSSMSRGRMYRFLDQYVFSEGSGDHTARKIVLLIPISKGRQVKRKACVLEIEEPESVLMTREMRKELKVFLACFCHVAHRYAKREERKNGMGSYYFSMEPESLKKELQRLVSRHSLASQLTSSTASFRIPQSQSVSPQNLSAVQALQFSEMTLVVQLSDLIKTQVQSLGEKSATVSSLHLGSIEKEVDETMWRDATIKLSNTEAKLEMINDQLENERARARGFVTLLEKKDAEIVEMKRKNLYLESLVNSAEEAAADESETQLMDAVTATVDGDDVEYLFVDERERGRRYTGDDVLLPSVDMRGKVSSTGKSADVNRKIRNAYEQGLLTGQRRAAFYRQLFMQDPTPRAVLSGKNLHILTANESFSRITQYSESELQMIGLARLGMRRTVIVIIEQQNFNEKLPISILTKGNISLSVKVKVLKVNYRGGHAAFCVAVDRDE